MTPERSTHVDAFTGTTSSFSSTVSRTIAGSPWPADKFCGGSVANRHRAEGAYVALLVRPNQRHDNREHG